MIKRMVYVEEIETQSLAIGSVMEIGDVHRAAPYSRILAVQKEGGVKSDVYDFDDYSIFSLKSTPPLSPIQINSFTYHHRPIQVDQVRVIGVSTAGIFQVGGVDHVDATNYTKHFRVLENEEQ
ncbi:spore germination protein GerPE [Halobacillus litoralis]|uniref:Spore germination protein GerPE n=2 Tax=Halobacillus litoralis TaxID=45668 RepID=A0A845E5Z1_9BACI|nr:spore germination protein GerPE [Halobacillus litoralis]